MTAGGDLQGGRGAADRLEYEAFNIEEGFMFVIVNVIVMENIAVELYCTLQKRRDPPRFQKFDDFGPHPSPLMAVFILYHQHIAGKIQTASICMQNPRVCSMVRFKLPPSLPLAAASCSSKVEYRCSPRSPCECIKSFYLSISN